MSTLQSIKYTLIFLFFFTPILNFAQSNEDLIGGIQELMLENYVFLDKAKETNEHLTSLMEADFFDDFSDPQSLAEALTQEMRKITKDKHLGMVAPQQPQEAPDSDTEAPHLQSYSRYYQPMLNEFKYYDNNVGYLDMRYFGGAEESFAEIDAVMKQLSQADAIIIDMRQNGGGSPRMVQYLSSYFFDEHFLLNSIYTRATDHTEELWTVEVKGDKRPLAPLFILTSQKTFSAAEDLSYTLQQTKRAITIGETTGGGAHPTRYFPLQNGFGIRIPFARSINPVTNTNWEGVGVVPDVEISADEALGKALELASTAAVEFKSSFFKPLETTLNALEESHIEDSAFKLVDAAVKANMLDERDINISGYNYLHAGKTNAAITLFKTNTILFPNSANVYDSFAEALASDGQMKLALANYEKAVSVAEEQDHYDLELFKRNLAAFKESNE